MIERAQYIIKGMSKDNSVSKFNPEEAYDIQNFRLVATNDGNTYSLVNEKGTSSYNITLDGTPIGQCVVGDNLIVFTTGGTASSGNPDSIYKFQLGDSNLTGGKLYHGNFSFSTSNPIEALPLYENENLIKVYWVDGINQPRVMSLQIEGSISYFRISPSTTSVNYSGGPVYANIDTNLTETWSITGGNSQSQLNSVQAGSSTVNTSTLVSGSYFDFVQPIPSNIPTISISKNTESTGLFAPGVIQYVCSYYSLHRQESALFYISPLYYTSFSNRGAQADTTLSNSFTITINPGTGSLNFDFIRVYAIFRTSLNSQPTARKVIDIQSSNLSSTFSFIDNGEVGESIDPTELLYKGGIVVKAGAIAQKNNTLFLGNFEIESTQVPTSVKNAIQGNLFSISTNNYRTEYNYLEGHNKYYPYKNQLALSSKDIKHFKYREKYRLGVQLQKSDGTWSSPIFKEDIVMDKAVDAKIYTDNNPNTNINLPYYKASLSSISSTLTAAGYINIRPVVVYPTLADRECICQGMICPTVYNVEDRANGNIFAQSSWFVRPFAPSDFGGNSTNTLDYNTNISNSFNSRAGSLSMNFGLSESTDSMQMDGNKGAWAEFRNGYPVGSSWNRNGEIQCVEYDSREATTPKAWSSSWTSKTNWINSHKHFYFIDQSIFTLHSPDIEFDEELQTLDYSNLRFRIVGVIPFTTNVSELKIQTSTPPKTKSGTSDLFYGTYKEAIETTSVTTHGWKSRITSLGWVDESTGAYASSYKDALMYTIYPWQRQGSLNYQQTADSTGYTSAMLLKKQLSNLKISYSSLYEDLFSYENSQISIGLFNSNEVSVIKLDSQNGESPITYYGNIDKVITYPSNYNFTSPKWWESGNYTYGTNGYSIISSREGSYFTDNAYNPLLSNIYITAPKPTLISPSNIGVFNSPVSLRYKSTPHVVIALKEDNNHKLPILPTFEEYNNTGVIIDSNFGALNNSSPFWSDTINGVTQGTVECLSSESSFPSDGFSQSGSEWLHYTTRFGFLWLGELYRTVSNKFGGTSEAALEANHWEIAGSTVKIESTANVEWTEGDTYYQRYDCLKTYPFSTEDINQVTEIASFMCETYINIDGRWDRNRGLKDNTAISPTNFNLFNPVYSQKNNFFTFSIENAERAHLNKFSNTITWSKTKTLGEDIDTWTNITLASTIDADGDKGEIRAIRNFNDQLIVFQDRGLSSLQYNESAIISTDAGVPIELANSGKVNGIKYINNRLGCTNKWSIVETKNGLYFVDDTTKGFYRLNNNGITNLSDLKGFKSWFNSTFTNVGVWNPSAFNNCITYYDKVNGEVLIITATTCLVYNELLDKFTSFYSYGKTPYFAYLKDVGIMIHKNSNDNNYSIHKFRGGNYNDFFGTTIPSSITIVANPEPIEDKTFTTIEYRADTLDSNNKLLSTPVNPFNTFRVWNEYQDTTSGGTDSSITNYTKCKFRIWRTQIPRDSFNSRDRIRNPWTYIKMTTNSTNYKRVIHDFIVSYIK